MPGPPTRPCSPPFSTPLPRSVIFFTSLVLVGFGLPAFVKKPIKQGWAKCKQLVCCGRGARGPTKLPAPAGPAAEGVDAAAADVAAADAAAVAPAPTAS